MYERFFFVANSKRWLVTERRAGWRHLIKWFYQFLSKRDRCQSATFAGCLSRHPSVTQTIRKPVPFCTTTSVMLIVLLQTAKSRALYRQWKSFMTQYWHVTSPRTWVFPRKTLRSTTTSPITIQVIILYDSNDYNLFSCLIFLSLPVNNVFELWASLKANTAPHTRTHTHTASLSVTDLLLPFLPSTSASTFNHSLLSFSFYWRTHN